MIAQKMGGGGHFSKAAVVFETNDFNRVTEILLDTLNRYLSNARVDKGNVEEE